MEYVFEWKGAGKLPLQIELTCAFGAKGEPMRHVFWIPPKQNPEVYMRQLQQQSANKQNPTSPSTPVPDVPSVPTPNPGPSE
jgi:hypothetical protein